MWEEPEKDKGRDAVGEEGGGEVDREKGEGTKGNPRATNWEGTGSGTAAERIMGLKAVERVGCDRMGEVHGKNGRDSWEE